MLTPAPNLCHSQREGGASPMPVPSSSSGWQGLRPLPRSKEKPPDTSGGYTTRLVWKLARAGSPNIGHKFQKSKVPTVDRSRWSSGFVKVLQG